MASEAEEGQLTELVTYDMDVLYFGGDGLVQVKPRRSAPGDRVMRTFALQRTQKDPLTPSLPSSALGAPSAQRHVVDDPIQSVQGTLHIR